MKIKTLLLGSVAAAGLSTGAHAADLGVVLTSLDVCDQLNMTGLTLSSDSNCLQISGGASYEFKWGDYMGAPNNWFTNTMTGGTYTTPDNDAAPGPTNLDWESHAAAWLGFVGAADSSFGTAQAVIQIDYAEDTTVHNGVTVSMTPTASTGFTTFTPSHATSVSFSKAYVQVGDTTVLTAGRGAGSIAAASTSAYNYLGTFNGIGFGAAFLGTGGDVIQLSHDFGNGLTLAGGLENLDGQSSASTGADDGTAIGVLTYTGDTFSAHANVLAGGILDGVVENWGIDAGASASFDMFDIAGGFSADNSGYWSVLGSAQATFDMFKLAVTGEAANAAVGILVGAGGSITANVTDGVTINLGGRWVDRDTGVATSESGQVEAELVAALTETLSASGKVGVLATNDAAVTAFGVTPTVYFEGALTWAPGGDFSSTLSAGGNDDGAYWVDFKASKDFQ
jgi:hypothetical protein